MKNFEFAVVTPSYAPDFERCKLLAWSVQKFISPAVTHYIIVPEKDLALFKQIEGPKTEVITVRSVLPWWIRKIPVVKNGWLSLRTPPIRNWILQQIVKISAAKQVNRDVLVFVDSDTAFVRPFNFQNFVKDDRVRLFHAEQPPSEKPDDWGLAATKLLGLSYTHLPNYVTGIISWRRDNVLKMYNHIESVSGRGHVETIASSWHLSEYVLYGTFADYVLKEDSGHYWDAGRTCKEYWSTENMTDEQLEQFFGDIEPGIIAAMVSAKANISPSRYQTLLETVPAT
ncbi:MAG: hypothetical protein HC866_27085 [Leptolyngbyaceae cyanobacterium RU_5_1]|nr:hypothetical protein [Leptolyngbyaceae cyanobacterium RU_5_1]